MKPTTGKYCFTHKDGSEVFLYTLCNENGTEVRITNLGGIITSFRIPMPDGTSNDIVLGFDEPEAYLGNDYQAAYPWFGAVVGRHANRVKNAGFELDGQRYHLTKNKGENQLHGGIAGFDRKVWEFVGQGELPHPWLELRYRSADGEEGYPGNLDISIRFELGGDTELSYEMNATCDKATVVNCTHHGYFNLDNSKGTIHDQLVKIYGKETLDQDDELVVTGTVSPVKGTPYDFTEFTRVGDGLAVIPEYDKSYVTTKQPDSLIAEVKSPGSGLHMKIYSTEPIVHFYSGKWIPVVKGKDGTLYGPFSALCLETHRYPNAMNVPHFPTITLRPGDVYHHRTLYRVTHV